MKRFYPLFTAVTCIFSCLVVVSCDAPPPPIDLGTRERPVELPASELTHLDGTAAFFEDYSVSDIYNGTTWTIQDVDVSVTNTNTNQNRRFRLSCVNKIDVQRDEWKVGEPLTRYEDTVLKPYSTGYFRGTGGDFMKGLTKDDISFSIVGARGFKE